MSPEPAGGWPGGEEPGQAMNYSCSGAEWNKGSEDTGGVVSGFKDLLLLLYVVFLLLLFFC